MRNLKIIFDVVFVPTFKVTLSRGDCERSLIMFAVGGAGGSDLL